LARGAPELLPADAGGDEQALHGAEDAPRLGPVRAAGGGGGAQGGPPPGREQPGGHGGGAGAPPEAGAAGGEDDQRRQQGDGEQQDVLRLEGLHPEVVAGGIDPADEAAQQADPPVQGADEEDEPGDDDGGEAGEDEQGPQVEGGP